MGNEQIVSSIYFPFFYFCDLHYTCILSAPPPLHLVVLVYQ